MKRDLYDILGVSKTADADTIKKAYRKLARASHPDVNPGDAQAEERFKRVSAAFDVLSNPKKRKLYDEFGYDGLREGFDAQRARAYRQAGGRRGARATGFEGGATFEDIFGSMFGGGGAGFGQGFGMPMKGRDLSAKVVLSFMESLKGKELEFSVNGKPLKVRVPGGVTDGERLKLKGKGGEAPRTQRGTGEPGDLYLELSVRPHERLRREGLHLYLEVPITMAEALLGASIAVPTPWGKYTVKVPAGVNAGARLRLKGQGVHRGKEKGNFYAVLQIQSPDRIDASVRKAAQTLAKAYKKGVRADLRL
ncbi:molecular chaperone DnaJ [Lujinxingia litoralis]|uniref:Molecular chaperone DnaJ n=1 Tax=Lujinxingia litoralis TaxID=2211119 RepID=A0A328C8G2_9DELT|nr:DnaJ C-terminal domain-containing protein [Lujinxingia litoralis]RAL22215.1 molecular chaperone DnaJ [Lujinxingia litoralis]